MPIIVRCARCARTVELEAVPEAFECPGCGARYEAADLFGIICEADDAETDPQPFEGCAEPGESVPSPKDRMLDALSKVAAGTSATDAAQLMRDAMDGCVRDRKSVV